MNKAQQSATRKLNEAQEEYLLTYGWTLEGRRWKHPRFHNGNLLCTTTDALAKTRANPMFGRPDRQTG